MVSHIDKASHEVGLADPASFHEGLLTNISDGNIYEIKDFLSRPVPVRTNEWQAGSNINAQIDSINIPLDIITTSKAMSQKLSGFLGFRATAVIRLQVNTNRFQQGRLMMTFFPQQQIAQSKEATVYSSLMCRTQLPRVDFDASTDTEVILRIPYISPTLGFDTTDGTGSVGRVAIVVYSPLVAVSGELSAEYTIWGHFEDVELFYPTVTYNSVIPQSGSTGHSRKRHRRATVGKRDPQYVEEESDGFISSSLNKISKAATIINDIPLLSSVAGPVAWATGVAANVASAFGFSNPPNTSQAMLVSQRPWMRAMNASGQDNSYNLGVAEDNCVEQLPGFAGQDLDEMAMSYPLSIWTWVNTFEWLDTNVTYDPLRTLILAPSGFTTSINGGLTQTTPVSYFATMFKLYRGSLKFKLKFVKTEFHSGRLLVLFRPRGPNAPTFSLTPNTIPYLHRETVDIRDTTEHEFTVPYASTRPYLDVSEAYGELSFLVLNELRHPDTVAPKITILLEMAAAGDFEFAVPTNPLVTPVLTSAPAIPQSGNHRNRVRRSRMVPQVGETSAGQTTVNATTEPEPGGLGTAKVVHDSMLSARSCIGEKIMSIRQLIKRATVFQQYGSMPVGSGISIYPWQFNIPGLRADILTPTTYTTTPVGASSPLNCPDYLTMFAACYAFYRGSVRLKFHIADSDKSVNGRMFYETVAANNSTPLGFASTNLGRNSTQHASLPFDTSVMAYPEVQIPYYNKTHMSVVGTSVSVSNPNLQLPQNTYSPMISFKTSNYNSTTTNTTVTRQAGEDFSFGFWTGSPPVAPITTIYGNNLMPS